MYDVATKQNLNGEYSYQTRTGGYHVILRDVQQCLPVSAEYFPEIPERLMPTLRVSGGGSVHHTSAICSLISFIEPVVSLWSFPASYSLVPQPYKTATHIRGVDYRLIIPTL